MANYKLLDRLLPLRGVFAWGFTRTGTQESGVKTCDSLAEAKTALPAGLMALV